MTDEELEQHIADLGRLIVKSYREGDRASAVAWSAARTAAIKGRSPAQVARMERDLGLDGGCFFDRSGEQDRAALLERGA